MNFHRLHLLPGCIFLLVMVTFGITYLIAVLNDHVEPKFPYISDTGTDPPESCIFAQFINIAAFLLLGCVYVRYLQVEEVMKHARGAVQMSRWCNRTGAWVGVISCLGLDLVANFQEGNVIVVHMIGAFGCFFSSTIFFLIQTYISRKLMSELTSSCAFYTRLLISFLCIVLCLLTVVPGTYAMKYFEGEDTLHWKPEDKGWTLHLISTISEWALVLCFCIFIASFSGEFKGLTLRGPYLKISSATPKSVQTV